MARVDEREISLGADRKTAEIRPAEDYGPLDRAIAKLPGYDWLIFTSANGVRHFVERLDRSPYDWRALRANSTFMTGSLRPCRLIREH